MNAQKREFFGSFGCGKTKRYFVEAYNETLKKFVRMRRSVYNYLISIGDWDLGITKLPEGHVIHHIDLNEVNDEIENLQLLTISEHRKLHDSLNPARRNNVSIAMKQYWADRKAVA